jgi:hypothetical protein
VKNERKDEMKTRKKVTFEIKNPVVLAETRNSIMFQFPNARRLKGYSIWIARSVCTEKEGAIVVETFSDIPFTVQKCKQGNGTKKTDECVFVQKSAKVVANAFNNEGANK